MHRKPQRNEVRVECVSSEISCRIERAAINCVVLVKKAARDMTRRPVTCAPRSPGLRAYCSVVETRPARREIIPARERRLRRSCAQLIFESNRCKKGSAMLQSASCSIRYCHPRGFGSRVGLRSASSGTRQLNLSHPWRVTRARKNVTAFQKSLGDLVFNRTRYLIVFEGEHSVARKPSAFGNYAWMPGELVVAFKEERWC
jgi:hypothetical protein